MCKLPLSAGFGNTLNAGHTTVPGTDNSQLTYHWRFRYPENRNGGVEYIDPLNRIHGEDTSTVTIDRDALPNLGSVVGENEWRAILTITNNAGPTPQETEFRFRFRYFGSGLVIALSSPP